MNVIRWWNLKMFFKTVSHLSSFIPVADVFFTRRKIATFSCSTRSFYRQIQLFDLKHSQFIRFTVISKATSKKNIRNIWKSTQMNRLQLQSGKPYQLWNGNGSKVKRNVIKILWNRMTQKHNSSIALGAQLWERRNRKTK